MLETLSMKIFNTDIHVCMSIGLMLKKYNCWKNMKCLDITDGVYIETGRRGNTPKVHI